MQNEKSQANTLARRIAEMVGVLYARGHQLLDFHPHIAGAGYYRYILTVEAHPEMPRVDDPRSQITVWESLAGAVLPWTDDPMAPPESLADAFVAHYPRLALASRGERPDRARWHADMLRGTAPDGFLVHWYDEWGDIPPGHAAVFGTPGVKIWPLPPGYRHPLWAPD